MRHFFWLTLFFLILQAPSLAAAEINASLSTATPLTTGIATPFDFDALRVTGSDPEIQPQWSLDTFADVSLTLQKVRQGEKTTLIRTLMRPILIAGGDGPQNQPEPGAFLHERLLTLVALGFVEDAQALMQQVSKDKRSPLLHDDAVLLMLMQNRRVDACSYAGSIPTTAAKIRTFCMISVQDTDGAQLLMDLEGEQNPSAPQDPFWILVGHLLNETPITVDSGDPLSVMLALYQKKSFDVPAVQALAVPFYGWIANAAFMPKPTRLAAAEAGLAADVFSPGMVRALYAEHPPFTDTELASPKKTLETLDNGLKSVFLWQWSQKNPTRLTTLMRLLPETGLPPQTRARLFEPVLQNTVTLNAVKPSAALISSLLYLGDEEQAKALWERLGQQALDQSVEAMRELLKTWGYDSLFALNPRVSGHAAGWQSLIQNIWEKTAYSHQVATLNYLTGRAKAAPSGVTTGFDITKLVRGLQDIRTSPPTRLTLGKYFSMIKSYAPEQKLSFAQTVYAP
jgi:hypothetical protein